MNDLRTEDRLRSALHARAGDLHPEERGSLDRIRRRSATIRTRRRVLFGGAGIAAAIVAGVALVSLPDDSTELDTTPPATEPTTATTTEPSVPVTDVTPTTAVDHVPEAVWPPPGMPQFTDPVVAARTFAQEFLGIPDPPLGEFRGLILQSDPPVEGGEVDMHARTEDGDTLEDVVRSTITLRREGDLWGVMGAHSPAIVVENPQPLGPVGEPVVVDGRGRGFEATLIVSVRDADGEELASAIGMGGCCETLEPFHVEIDATTPAGTRGAIVVHNDDPSGVGIPDFTVVPVVFSDGEQVAADERVVNVYWIDGDGDPARAERVVSNSQGVLRSAIQQLLFGPTSDERDSGLSSGLSPEAAQATLDVVLTDGAAVIDFSADLPELSPNTSTSAGSMAFLQQLHATVFQFDTVESVEYRIGGSCEAFWAWLQGDCRVVTRDDPGF